MGLTRRAIIQSGMAGLFFMAAPALARSPVAVPEGPMVLRRIIQRDLSGGASIEVQREWRVSFTRTADLIVIDGEQISVEVLAPENLARLADMERNRQEDRFFPLTLSPTGLILGGDAKARSNPLAGAVEVARSLLVSSPLSMEMHQQNLAAIAAGGAALLETMPRDLFYPESGEQVVSETMALPDGAIGEFEQRFTASPNPSGGWLDKAERRIITRLGHSTQTSREIWDLRTAS